MASIFQQFAQGAEQGQKMADRRLLQNQQAMALQQEERQTAERRAALDAERNSEIVKKVMAEQPEFAGTLMKKFGTDKSGMESALDDAVMYRYWLEVDPSGKTGREFLLNRKEHIINRGTGNTFQTDQQIATLENEGVEVAKANIDSMINAFSGMGKGGSGNKKFEKQEQFEQLQELKKTGTPEQIQEYRALIGLDKPVKMSSTSEKALDKAQESAFSADTAARKMELLANDISKIDIGGGVQAGWSETLKNLLGSQDEVSNLRREFRSIRSSQAVRNLPPGVASDKDIALALSGFPREDAPASEIKSFLNGQAKLAKYEAEYNNFKSDYISTTKGISGFGKAWRKQAKDEDYLNNILTIDAQTQKVPKPEISSQDAQALEWAKNNPNDPRSTAILKKQGRL